MQFCLAIQYTWKAPAQRLRKVSAQDLDCLSCSPCRMSYVYTLVTILPVFFAFRNSNSWLNALKIRLNTHTQNTVKRRRKLTTQQMGRPRKTLWGSCDTQKSANEEVKKQQGRYRRRDLVLVLKHWSQGPFCSHALLEKNGATTWNNCKAQNWRNKKHLKHSGFLFLFT